MPTIEFEITLPRPLQDVWDFHQDVVRNLPRLSPPEQQMRIEHADLPLHEGSRLVVAGKGPVGLPVRWQGRIVEHLPPRVDATGRWARFTDEADSSPFDSWRHEHEMRAVDERDTRLIDRVTYRVPLGPLGWLADTMFVRTQLCAMFRHRHEAMKRWALGGEGSSERMTEG